jgi:hypothetical protein
MSGVTIPAYLASLFSQRAMRVAGALGALGALLGAFGDLSTGYAVTQPPAMNTVMWLSLADFVEFLALKSQWDLLLGHYLGVLFIPLNVLGLWHVYLALAPANVSFAVLFLGVGTFLAVVGSVFHGMVGPVVTAARVGGEPTLVQVAAYFEPIGLMLTVFGMLLFLALAGRIWMGRTVFPRWMAWVSPAVMQVLLTGLAYVTPLQISVALLITGFNLSVFLFFAISTLRLWHHDPLSSVR